MAKVIEKGVRVRTRKEKNTFYWQLVRGFLQLLAFVCLAVVIWYVTRLDVFTIDTVTISGGETVSHDEIKALVERELVGTYFLIIPKRFTYLYPEDRIIEVLENVDRVHSVVSSKPTRKELHVSFKEYTPFALWCSMSDTNLCYFMTKDAYAFAEAPVLQGGVFIRHYFDIEREMKEGEVMPRDEFIALESFIERVESELSLRTSAVYHKKNGDTELRINGGGMIFFSKERSYEEIFENLKTILQSSEFSHIKPGNFNYIDLRFGNKVYVNEKKEVKDEGDTTLPE